MTLFVNPLDNTYYFEQTLFLYIRYSRFLDDDYAQNGQSVYDYFLNLVRRTLFYSVIEGDVVSGFVYLDNFIGGSGHFHSAELVTCFDERFWGNYTKDCARFFLDYCFSTYGFYKIKALVYPENFRVKTLLKYAGFEKEGLLKDETLRNDKLQDIEIYACRRKGRK